MHTHRHVAFQLLAVGMLMTGCGGSNDANSAEGPSHASSAAQSSTASSPSAEAPKATLLKTCPEVEKVVRDVDPMFATQAEVLDAAGRIQGLADAGDTETQNALADVAETTGNLAYASQGQDMLERSQDYLYALDNLADRCKAVGSSALQ